jgi:hypothetical protein
MTRVNSSNSPLITACRPNGRQSNLLDEFHTVVIAGIQHLNHDGIASALVRNALNINSQGSRTSNGRSVFSWALYGPDNLGRRKGKLVDGQDSDYRS